ncbi:CNMamide [Cochliomyia hominivorax]
MFCHKISLTMKCKNMKLFNRRSRPRQQQHHQFSNILMLSIIWTMLFTETMARPNLENLLSSKPTNEMLQEEEQQPQQQQQQQPSSHDLFLDEIMTNAYENKLYNKLKKYHHSQPNLLNKWPGLRDLVLALDYDDTNNLEESNEFLNTKFFERLQQLASTKSESYDEDIRDYNLDANVVPSKSMKSSASLSANQLTFKDHNIKKNVQYMSPCHFKICNMGRKRNARLLKNY